jgi:precorrin-2 dehydrogenase/sirohydrochlorin ferrochelatase
MRYLPIELDVLDKEALVIGSGAEAASKVDRLLAAGARVTVVAPPAGEVHAAIEARAREGRISIARRAVEPGDLQGKVVIFLEPGESGEPGDADLSRRLYEEASRSGRLVCTLDRPELSTFANPAVARVAGLTMSFGSGGVSPSVVRRIREDLEALFSDPRFARMMGSLAKLRASLSRGERSPRMKEAAKGFAIEARLRFPAWVERGTDAGDPGASEAPGALEDSTPKGHPGDTEPCDT